MKSLFQNYENSFGALLVFCEPSTEIFPRLLDEKILITSKEERKLEAEAEEAKRHFKWNFSGL